jgi:hypothetical protein
MTASTADVEVTKSPAVSRRLPGIARHWMFGLLFVAGVVLRVVTFRAYQPALLYIDSLSYLGNMELLDPTWARPFGYAIFLKPLLAFDDLRIVPIVHHLFGLGLAVGIYVLLLRAGAHRWIAALAAVPVLLDAYQLQIEQNVLSETLFQVLTFVGLVLLVDGAGRRRRFGRRVVTAVLAGVVLGVAVPVRLIGQFVLIPGVLYLLLTGAGERQPAGGWARTIWQRTVAAGAFALVFIAPVAVYVAYYHSWTGEYSTTPIAGRMLYARVAPVVDCDRIDIAWDLRDLCPVEPLGQRQSIDRYMWTSTSPIATYTPPAGMTLDQSLRAFGMAAVRQQPFDVGRAVLIDIGKNFWPRKTRFYPDVDVARWHFQERYPRYNNYDEWLASYGAVAQVDRPLAHWLRSYQLSVGYTPGTVLGVFLLVGLAGGLGVGRARHSPLRAACLLWSLVGAMVMLLPSVYEFSWRYMLPGLVTLPVAGGLGLTALMDRTPAGTAEQPPSPAEVEPDADDDDRAIARDGS